MKSFVYRVGNLLSLCLIREIIGSERNECGTQEGRRPSITHEPARNRGIISVSYIRVNGTCGHGWVDFVEPRDTSV